MAKIAEEDLLRIPSPKKMQALTELLQDDEDFRFPRIKLHREKPKYELPEPTAEDRDNFEMRGIFKATILVARKNFFQSDEDKAAGKDPKEKRALYVLRPGKVTPELVYVNPTSLKAWKMFVKQVMTSGQQYYSVLCEFSAEHVKSAKSGYSWNKMNFKIDRTLTAEELEHVEAIRQLVDARVKTYEDDSDLDKFEDEALGIRQPDEEDQVDRHSKTERAKVEEADEDEPKAKKPGSSTKKKDEPAKPKEDDDPPKKPGNYPSLDDADDDLAKVKKKDADGDEDTPPKRPPSLDDED